MIHRWLIMAFLYTTMVQTDVDSSHQRRITIGSGTGCHYPTEHLNQAIQEHNTIYLTTGDIYPPIRINNPHLEIIGGLSNCEDWKPDRNGSQKSLISGFHSQRPVTISTNKSLNNEPHLIRLKGLRLINGYAEQGGGLGITGPARVHLDNTDIENNVATLHGGGISLHEGAIELELNNSFIQFNQAEKLGGGISCDGNHLIRAQNEQQIINNSASLADNLLIDQHCFIKFNQPE